jgi:hypothetical protein
LPGNFGETFGARWNRASPAKSGAARPGSGLFRRGAYAGLECFGVFIFRLAGRGKARSAPGFVRNGDVWLVDLSDCLRVGVLFAVSAEAPSPFIPPQRKKPEKARRHGERVGEALLLDDQVFSC